MDWLRTALTAGKVVFLLRIKNPCWLLLLLSMAACGNNEEQNFCAAGPREGYPAGPYGVTQGETISDLAFVTPEDSTIRLGDIHRDSSARLLLLATAAEWCTACVEEQSALQDLYEQYGEQGLVVLVSVFEDANGDPADASLAATWRDRFGLTVTVAADPSFALSDYYDANLTPMNMLVDVCQMEIIEISTGWDPSLVEAMIEVRL